MTMLPYRTDVGVMAKAPIAGYAKTRLVGALGEAGAARLHRRLAIQTLATATEAGLGCVTVWCTPDTTHRFFLAVQSRFGVRRRPQPPGHLGARMVAAFEGQEVGIPLLVIGTYCDALGCAHLHSAAEALHRGSDGTVLPAEDGSYVLIGLRRPEPALFRDIAWGTDRVMAQTRDRARALGLRLHEGETLWDVDRPDDLHRLAHVERAGRR